MYDKKNPPRYGELTAEQFKLYVDPKKFPTCCKCKQPILNPKYFKSVFCGPCITGDWRTIMT